MKKVYFCICSTIYLFTTISVEAKQPYHHKTKSLPVSVSDTIQTVNRDCRPLLACNQFSPHEIDSINAALTNQVKKSQSKRDKVVTSAKFMVDFPYSIPYGYESFGYPLAGRYMEKGLFLKDAYLNGKVFPAWGCAVVKPLKPLDNVFENKLNLDSTYANGLHCSSFIGWCLYNADVAGKDLLNKTFADQYADFPGSEKVPLKDALCSMRAGDLLWFPGHVAVIIEITENEVKYAESALFQNDHTHPENGLRWRIFNKSSENYEKFRFKYLIKMDGAYK